MQGFLQKCKRIHVSQNGQDIAGGPTGHRQSCPCSPPVGALAGEINERQGKHRRIPGGWNHHAGGRFRRGIGGGATALPLLRSASEGTADIKGGADCLLHRGAGGQRQLAQPANGMEQAHRRFAGMAGSRQAAWRRRPLGGSRRAGIWRGHHRILIRIKFSKRCFASLGKKPPWRRFRRKRHSCIVFDAQLLKRLPGQLFEKVAWATF